MFPDLLLNAHNVGPKVRFAPLDVTSDIQIESVEMGEARERNHTANNEDQIPQSKDYKTRNTAEKIIKFLVRCWTQNIL